MLNESSTVQELLAEIRAKKERLIKEKKIKKAKPLPPIDNDEQPFEIPNNWKWVRLGDIATIITGTTPSKKEPSYYGGNFPFYKPSNIQSNKYLYPADEYLSELGKAQARFIPKNSIAVNCIGNIGKAAMFPTDGTTNQQINSICHYLYPEYLYWVCQSDFFITQLLDFSSATTISIVNKSKVERTIIPLPPLFEQHRLVARIESLFAKLDAAKEKVQSVLNSHETRKAALLHDAFTGKLTAKWREEQGISLVNWQTRSLSDCGTWKGGGTPSKAHPDYWENGEIMWVTSKDMKSDKIQDTQMHITPLGVEQSSAIYSEKPAVLFVTRSGILRHTLPVALVNRPFTTNQDLKSLTPNENIDTQYLFFAAKAFSGQILKTCMKNGTTVESINTKKLMEFLLPIASMREQKVIAKMLRQLLNKEQRAQQAAEETLTVIDRMKQAILARAFRGEL